MDASAGKQRPATAMVLPTGKMSRNLAVIAKQARYAWKRM
jgi:hypothetical protein